MDSLVAVIIGEVVLDEHFHFRFRLPLVGIDEFPLDGLVERFYHGVVHGRSRPTHRVLDTLRLQKVSIGIGAVLSAAIRMDDVRQGVGILFQWIGDNVGLHVREDFVAPGNPGGEIDIA